MFRKKLINRSIKWGEEETVSCTGLKGSWHQISVGRKNSFLS